MIEHNIDVGEAKPIEQRLYRINPEKCKFLDLEINYMLKNGIVEPSLSSWASPYLFVQKSDNNAFFCSDFRKVNSMTKPDSYSLPFIDDCINQVGDAKFIKFDLLKDY